MDNRTTKEEIDAVSLEVISSIVQSELIQGMMLAPTLSDYSALATPGSDKVKVPRAGSFTAEKKLSATDFSSQALTFATDDIALDEDYGVFATVENIASLQANIDLVGQYAARMATALAYQMDQKIYVQMKLASASSPDHRIAFDNASTLAKNDFVAAKKKLKVANVPLNDGKLFCAISPERESDILKLSDFIDADKYGAEAVAAKMNGVIGKIYGFNVIVSNVVEDAACIFYHSSHVGWARQQAPLFDNDKNLKAKGFDLLLSHVYGVKVMDSGKRGILVGSAS